MVGVQPECLGRDLAHRPPPAARARLNQHQHQHQHPASDSESLLHGPARLYPSLIHGIKPTVLGVRTTH